MENKVNIKEFVEKFKQCTTEDEKTRLVMKNITITPYVKVLEKVITIENIIKVANYDKNKKLCINSCIQQVFYVLSIMKLYTNLEVDYTNPLECYDLLEESGLTDIIMLKIPEKEAMEYSNLFTMAVSDFKENHCGIRAYMENELKNIETVLNGVVDRLSNTVTQ